MLRWRLDTGRLEPGVWVRKKVFVRRCDLSSDGELLSYYLSGGVEGQYQVFGGISRAPWLHPLVSWREIGTWGRGCRFVEDASVAEGRGRREIELGSRRVVVQDNEVGAWANEMRRGWVEAPECPARHPKDVWDERRSVILQKPCATNGCVLWLIGGRYQPEGGIDGRVPRYEVALASGEVRRLDDAAWAEWDAAGRLLVATKDGWLEARDVSAGETMERHDLRGMKPEAQEAPEWAKSAMAAREA